MIEVKGLNITYSLLPIHERVIKLKFKKIIHQIHNATRQFRLDLMSVCPCIVAYASRRTNYMPLNGSLHLRYAQHVSGTSMPIIRRWRICVLLPPMVCDALVAGCWRSDAGQPAMRPE